MKKAKLIPLLLLALLLSCSLALVGCGGSSLSDSPAEPAEPAEWEVFLDEFEDWVERCEKVASDFDADPFNASLQEEVKKITNIEAGEWKKQIAEQKEGLTEEELESFDTRLTKLSSRTDAVAKRLQETIDANSSSSTNSSDTDWEAFLNEYEAWVDSYVVFMQKYLANPTDVSLLSDYTKLADEMTDWSTKAEELQQSLSPEEAQKYSERLYEITGKLNAVVQGML